MTEQANQDGSTTDGGRRPVHFPPVLNGLDYLESAVAHLAGAEGGDPAPRSLKYATLHLQAAVETLFKARLALKHEKHVWQVEEEYDARRHAQGAFGSIKWDLAIRRLKKHCKPKPKTYLGPPRVFKALADMRNRFQHLGVADSDTMALEALSIPVLDTLLDFVADDLLPHVPREDYLAADAALERVRAAMTPVQALVERRLAPLRVALELHRGSTVACLSCGQFTVMLDGSDTVVCALCRRAYGSPENAAWEYAGTDEYTAVTGGGDGPVLMCDECGVTAAIAVPVACSPNDPVLICFADGMEFNGVCEGCGQAVNYAVPEGQLCQTCWSNADARF